jgi:hypothetical protein
MIVEGISYARYVITFTLANGRRRRWLRWGPGANFMCEAIKRELAAQDARVKGRVYVRLAP